VSLRVERSDLIPAWDGYQANRRRLLEHVHEDTIDNVVFFTGDTHANWMFENNMETTLQGGNDTSVLKNITTTKNEYQRGTIVEFGGTAVSSSGWGSSWGSYENSTVAAGRMVENNPALLYSEGYRECILRRQYLSVEEEAHVRPRIHARCRQLHPSRDLMVRIPGQPTGPRSPKQDARYERRR